MNKTQQGFGLIESLLIILILAVIGFGGYYVWHSQKPGKSPTQSNQVSQNANPISTASQKYITIKEWNVRIPYSGSDTYTYTYDKNTPQIIEIVSANLSQKYNCSQSGAGFIARDTSTDQLDSGITVGQDAKQNPDSYKIVDGYYYSIGHDQAACSDSVTAEAENQAIQAVMALQPKIESIPK